MLLAGDPHYPPLTLNEQNALEAWLCVIGTFTRLPA